MAQKTVYVQGHWKYYTDKNGKKRKKWVKGYEKTVNVHTKRWRW